MRAQTGAPASVGQAINERLRDGDEQHRAPFMRVRGHGLGRGSSGVAVLEMRQRDELEEGGLSSFIRTNMCRIPVTDLGDTVVMGKIQAESSMQSSWEIFNKAFRSRLKVRRGDELNVLKA